MLAHFSISVVVCKIMDRDYYYYYYNWLLVDGRGSYLQWRWESLLTIFPFMSLKRQNIQWWIFFGWAFCACFRLSELFWNIWQRRFATDTHSNIQMTFKCYNRVKYDSYLLSWLHHTVYSFAIATIDATPDHRQQNHFNQNRQHMNMTTAYHTKRVYHTLCCSKNDI